MFTTPPERMAELVSQAAAAGIATKIHAIGDAAVPDGRSTSSAPDRVAGAVHASPRARAALAPDDRARFGELGVAASVQPVHLREDAETARRDWGARAEANGYTWRSLLDAGAVVAFGTDAPVEPIDPWPGIAMAVLRRDPSWGARRAALRSGRGPDARAGAPGRDGRRRTCRRRTRWAAGSSRGRART